MANFSIPLLNQSITTSFRTAGLIWINTSVGLNRRIMVYEVEMGMANAIQSTDVQALWALSRITATASAAGTSITAQGLDSADLIFNTQCLNNLTAEPSYAAAGSGLNLKQWPINQRGFNRWRALDDGDNIIVPAVAANGIGVMQLAGTANTSGGSAMGALAAVER